MQSFMFRPALNKAARKLSDLSLSIPYKGLVTQLRKRFQICRKFYNFGFVSFCREISSSTELKFYCVILSFSTGSIAGFPTCCQQRSGRRLRREQGAPFCVRAPQMYAVSTASATFGAICCGAESNSCGAVLGDA